MDTLVGYIEKVLHPLLPDKHLRFVSLIGLLLALVVAPLVAWNHLVVFSGATLVVAPLGYRLIRRLALRMRLRKLRKRPAGIDAFAEGVVLYRTHSVTPQDTLVSLIVEQTGIAELVQIPCRVVLLKPEIGSRLTRDRTVTNVGSELAVLLGEPKDWSRLCGLLNVGSTAYFYVLAGSFGNRFMNRSGTLIYYDVMSEAQLRVLYYRRDDFHQREGSVTYEPSIEAMPKQLQAHALALLERSGFATREGDDPINREARFWNSTYGTAFRSRQRVTIVPRWFDVPPEAVDTTGAENVEEAIGNERYIITHFRNSPILRVRGDGKATVIYVTDGFVRLRAQPDGTLRIDDGIRPVYYRPGSGLLSS